MADLVSILDNKADDLYEVMLKENLDKRILVFNDEVSNNNLEDYILYILKWNTEDKNIPIDKRKVITIYINSPGGSCIDGYNFVDIILASKTPIRGICFGLAASMGYHIFLACHERYAFKNSVFLQHDGEVTISNSSSKAKDTMRFFNSMEARSKEHVLARTKMTEEFYDKIYDQEYYMYAYPEGQELGCVDKIIGIDCNLEEVL